MRHFHLRVYYAHCREDSFVEADESFITFARMYVLNGVPIREDWAELRFSPFGQLILHHPDPEESHPGFIVPYEVFLSTLTKEDWLEGSSRAHPIIPVSSFEFIEGNWFDDHRPSLHDPGFDYQAVLDETMGWFHAAA